MGSESPADGQVKRRHRSVGSEQQRRAILIPWWAARNEGRSAELKLADGSCLTFM